MKQFWIIKLVVWFGWLSYIALAQLELSDAVKGSVSFPAVGITCIGNLAAFMSSFLRRRLDLEMGGRDFIAAMTGPCRLDQIELTNDRTFVLARDKDETKDCLDQTSVVMLSTDVSNSSIRQFMKYIYNAHRVKSILLPCIPLKKAATESEIKSEIKDAGITCTDGCNCRCIVFWTRPDITAILNTAIPNNRPLAQSEKSKEKGYGLYLPSLQCPCTNHVNHVSDNDSEVQSPSWCHGLKRASDNPTVQFGYAIQDALDFEFTTSNPEKHICICIPVNHSSNATDKWTKLLIRFLKTKDQEDRGAKPMASDALENYLAESNGDRAEVVSYTAASIIAPRIAEILVNILLTLWFKVDGFSSSSAARRAIRSYVVDTKGNGLPANAFLTGALVTVKSNGDRSSVCQVLRFRGSCLLQTLVWIVAVVNFSCSIFWVVFVAFDVGIGKWYRIKSIPPSKPRVAVMIAGICISCFMDFYELFSKISCFEDFYKLFSKKSCFKDFYKLFSKKICGSKILIKMLLPLIVIEIGLAAALVVGLGLRADTGPWLYGAVQVLVWVKWIIGSYLLGVYSPEYDPTHAKWRDTDKGRTLLRSSDKWGYDGTLVYSSAFLLNAFLAGVRGNWAEVWQNWKLSG